MKAFFKFIILTLFFSFFVEQFQVHFRTKNLQKNCTNQIQRHITLSNELSTIVCGVNNLDDLDERKIKRLGLIHVFVMSASQISFWMSFIKKLKLNFLKTLGFVSFIHFFTGFQAPVMRYICHYFLVSQESNYKILKPHFQILICYVVCSFLVRETDLFSLQLSCLFTLMLGFFEKIDLKNAIVLQTVFYIFCIYIFSQDLSFLSIPYNVFLVPLLSFVLYPLGILIFLLTYTPFFLIGDIIFTKIWHHLFYILNWNFKFSDSMVTNSFSLDIEKSMNRCTFLFIVSFITIHFLTIHRNRTK